MTQAAQNRIKQIETDIERLTGALNSSVLTPGERAIAQKHLIEAEDERDRLESAEVKHWLNQRVTTKTRVIVGQLHEALKSKVLRQS